MLLDDIVGNVELGQVFWCHSLTEIADGEVRQISHAVDDGLPLPNGIAVGDDDDIASL